jgi:simple sugar transport system permease protein
LILVIAFLVFGVFLYVMGFNPLVVYKGILIGSFGSISGLSAVLNLSSVYILTALCAIIAFRCRIWNIGGEGQLYAGALGATVAALSGVSSYLVLPLALVASIVFGCLWSLIPTVLRIRFQADEVVSTVMMNYLILILINYLITGPLKDPLATGTPVSRLLPNSSRLPLIAGTQINVGFILTIAIVALVYFIVHKTVIGFRIDLVGGNPSAAKLAGISGWKTILLVMLVSSGLAGLAGGLIMSSETSRLLLGISNSYGYMGMGVAILGGLEPIWAIPSAIFFSALTVGGIVMQSEIGISFNFINAFQAVMVIVITLRFILSRGMNRLRAKS